MATGKSYKFDPPFKRRPITINTLCVVGVCTCIMIKIATEKAFHALGIHDIDVMPSVEDNPRGDRAFDPDIVMLEGLRIGELKSKMPKTIFIEIKDLANQQLIEDEIVKELTAAGWLKEE